MLYLCSCVYIYYTVYVLLHIIIVHTHVGIGRYIYSQIVAKSMADTRRPTVSVILPRPRQTAVKVTIVSARRR